MNKNNCSITGNDGINNGSDSSNGGPELQMTKYKNLWPASTTQTATHTIATKVTSATISGLCILSLVFCFDIKRSASII